MITFVIAMLFQVLIGLSWAGLPNDFVFPTDYKLTQKNLGDEFLVAEIQSRGTKTIWTRFQSLDKMKLKQICPRNQMPIRIGQVLRPACLD